MVDQLIKNPADNLRRWHGTACACTRCCEARRADFLARIKAQVDSDTYDADGDKLDACLDKLQADIDAVKLADVGAKPDLAEAERAAFDEINDGERWDGLS